MTSTSKRKQRVRKEPSTGLPTAYNPADHEERIRLRWESADAFHADPDRVLSGEKPPYCVLIPPPNVTGILHLGHALNNTLQDILVRMHRMKGHETLWMPGSDHAGIATQTVVEKRILAEGGKPRTQWNRDEFIARVQEWKDEYEARITNQLKLMGSSCDWSRQRFTMDEVCAKAVREAFFQLFKEGLIYRGKRLVNWDPVTQTALADDEVDMIEVQGAFYYMRYPLCDKAGEPTTANFPDGQTVDHVTVATTRPETYLGDTAVAVNPDDPRAPALKDMYVKLPLVGRIIPIIEDDYVVMPDPEGSDPKAKYATGFLKVTPAHDENDWLIGQRHNLEAINVLAPDASISDQHGWTDVGEAAIFVGLSREEARKKIVAEFEARGLLEEIKPYVHSVGHSYRSHAIIEPYLSDQWYVKVSDDRLVGRAQRALTSSQQSGQSKWLKNIPDSRTGVSPVIGHNLSIHKRKLPHWQQGGSVYFVTFRMKTGELTPDECAIVADACAHWHGERACVHLFTVMPDHVHLLIQPLERANDEWWPLQELIHSIKSYTAHAINQNRDTKGPVWQGEYFDRIIRDEAEYREKWQYMMTNPVKAGLVSRPEEYEFLRSPQWEDDGRDARPTGSCAADHGDGAMAIHPARYAKTYEAWHENLRDWCISRQLWWGHRIPVWHASKHQVWEPEAKDDAGKLRGMTGGSLEYLMPKLLQWEKEGRVSIQEGRGHEITGFTVTEHGDVSENIEGEDRFICVRDTDKDNEICDWLDAHNYRQDPDVLDTWFSSALWPLSTMGWPDPAQDAQFTGLLEAFKPTSVLCTARDIITLWVSRMVMFNRFFTDDGQIPFHNVYIHPVIQDGDGKRMSKSAGNGVDPLDIIHTHGADAMRFTLCQLASQTQDVRMPIVFDEKTGRNTSPKFDLGKRLCNKLWNASRFTMMMLAEAQCTRADGRDARPTGESEKRNNARPTVSDLELSNLPLVDRWILSRLAHAIERIESALDQYEFNVYSEILYDLLWNEFCDWYLEAIKPTIRSNPAQQCVLRSVLDCLLRLLHPVAPFVTEAIYEELRQSRPLPAPAGLTLGDADLLCLAPWPTIDLAWRDAEVESRFAELQELVGAIREARSQHNVLPKQRITLHTTDAMTHRIAEAGGIVETLAGLEAVTAQAPTEDSTLFTHAGIEHRLSGMSEQIDASTLRDSLEKTLNEVNGAIALLEKRLSNPGYTDKAPAKLVQQTRDQLDDKKAERESLAASLAKL